MNEEYGKITRLEIDLDRIVNNFREIRSIVNGKTLISAILKANAYGHGAVKIAETLSEEGCDRFAVSTLEEAIELRENNIKEEILLLSNICNNHLKYVVEYNLIPSIYNFDSAEYLNDLSKKANKRTKIHLAVDTGMGRIGFSPNEESINNIKNMSKLEYIEIEGMFSHFAKADEIDKTFTRKQYKIFMDFNSRLVDEDIIIPIKHISNSAAIVDLPEYNLDMVRTGIMIYGYYPSSDVNQNLIDIKPGIKLKTKLTHVQKIDKDTIRGIIPVGYADGYPRLLKYKSEVLIKDRLYPISSDVYMDQCIIDLKGNEDIKVGDDVVLIDDDVKSIGLEEVAEKAGTIHGEILSRQGRRVPRIYYKNSEVYEVLDYLDYSFD